MSAATAVHYEKGTSDRRRIKSAAGATAESGMESSVAAAPTSAGWYFRRALVYAYYGFWMLLVPAGLMIGAFFLFTGRVGSAPPDVAVKAITFHKPGSSLTNRADGGINCFNGQPFDVHVRFGKTGGPASRDVPDVKDQPRVRLVGRPVDGRPDEVVEASSPFPGMTRSRQPDQTFRFTPQIPPSFAGRAIVWTAMISHPYDQRHENDTQSVTLTTCKA